MSGFQLSVPHPPHVEGGLVDMIAADYDLLIKLKEYNILDQTTVVDELITRTIEEIEVELELRVTGINTNDDEILFDVVDHIKHRYT